MRHVPILALAALTACAAPPTSDLRRTEVPPPAAPPAAATAAERAPDATDEAATRAWLEDEVARQGGQPARSAAAPEAAPADPAAPPPAAVPPAAPRREVRLQALDEAATRAWLDETIELRRQAAAPPPPLPQQPQVVYVDRPVYRATGYYGGYDSYGEPVYGYDRGYRGGPTFPINTAVGAGIGALVSSRSHRDEGAAIGAGIGLLFDIANWSRY